MEKGKGIIIFVIFLISVMLTSLIFIQFRTVENNTAMGIESMQEEELRTQIAEWKKKTEEVNEKIKSNNEKIGEYTNIIQNNKQASELLDEELNEYEMLIGKTSVKGKGAIITCADSQIKTYTASNLNYIINELKAAGAEAISINGQRIVNMTDIVMIQTRYILVNGERIASPYVINVIGDQEKLNEALNFKNSGLVDYYRNSDYTIEAKLEDEVHVPAYNKQIELKYMKEAK